jgi:hypothetical protein
MVHQCYGFVKLSTPEEAREAQLAARAGAITIEGRPVRVDRAQGELPDWKQTGGGPPVGAAGGPRRHRPGGASRDGPSRAGRMVGGDVDLQMGGHVVPLLLVGGGAAAAVTLLPLAAAGGMAKQALLCYDDL